MAVVLHMLPFSVYLWVPLLGIRASSEGVLQFHYAHIVSYHYCCLVVLHLLYLHTYWDCVSLSHRRYCF